MLRTILTLQLAPEHIDPIVDLYLREKLLAEALANTDALSAEIAVATDDSNEIVVIAEWPDESAYQRWLDHPVRDRTSPQFVEILGEDNVGAGRQYIVKEQVRK